MNSYKILLADDEETIRAIIGRELRLENYTVYSARDGNEALALINDHTFDAVITDLVMPGIDGISVLKAAKNKSAQTSVLILTGYGDLRSAIDALRLGADDYITKPCDTDELLHRLSRSLEKISLLAQLKKQNRLLEQEIGKRRQFESKLGKSEKRFKLALDASSDGVWERNLLTNQAYYGENWHKSLGYEDHDSMNGDSKWESLVHPDDKKRVRAAREAHFSGKEPRYEVEYRIKNKAGNWQWILSRGKVIEKDRMGQPVRLVGTHTDITRLKAVEAELKETQLQLEQRVSERTAELEETNIALNVLLAKRERDKATLEQQIISNVAELIEPYLTKLEASQLTKTQAVYLNILKSNVNELTSSLSQNMAAKFTRLTPAEVQVANLVKLGKRTKEIADIMHLAPGTINIHRKNIRKKLGLTNQKVNLQTVLSSYS